MFVVLVLPNLSLWVSCCLPVETLLLVDDNLRTVLLVLEVVPLTKVDEIAMLDLPFECPTVYVCMVFVVVRTVFTIEPPGVIRREVGGTFV